MSPHEVMAQFLGLLPQPRAKIAEALGVSPSTLHGWAQAARGEPMPARRPGRAAPTAEQLDKARGLLWQHVEQCRAALRGEAPPA